MSKYLSNRGYEVINTILWVLAMAGMLGLLIAMKELRGLTKEASEYKTIIRK